MPEASIFDIPDSDEDLLPPSTFTRKREQQTIELSPDIVSRKRVRHGASSPIDLSEGGLKGQEVGRSKRHAAGKTGGPVERTRIAGETINLVTPDAAGRKWDPRDPREAREARDPVRESKDSRDSRTSREPSERKRKITQAQGIRSRNTVNLVSSDEEDNCEEEVLVRPSAAVMEREEREALEREMQLERMFPSEPQHEEKENEKEKRKREVRNLDSRSERVSPLPLLESAQISQAPQAARRENSKANSRPSSRQGEVTKEKGKEKAVPGFGNRQTMSAVEIPSVPRSPVRRGKPADSLPGSPVVKSRRGSAQISAQEIPGSPARRTKATEIPESPKLRRRLSIIDIVNSPEKRTKTTKGKSIEIPESPEIEISSKSQNRNTAPENVENSSTTSSANSKIDFKAFAIEREARRRAQQAQEQQEAVPPASFYGGVPNPVKSEKTASRSATPPPKGKGKAGSASNPYVLPSGPPTDAHAWYPAGVVKKTYIKGAENGPETITFKDVIQSTTLVTTVLSSFQWDYEWVLQQLPSRRDHKCLFIIHAKTEEERKDITEMLSFVPLLKLCFPKLEGQVNIMHSKLMLLFHKDGEKEWLRIVVPTGNLTDYDWGDLGGIMENMVFLIDLPKLPSINPEQTFFMQELLRFIGAQDVPESILNKIVGYDFSATEKMAFVHTIGGSILGEDARCTGYPGLATAIKQLGYDSGKGLEVDYVTSSLGALKEEFLTSLYQAAQGLDIIAMKTKTAAPQKTKKSTAPSNPHEPDPSPPNLPSNFRIYFPSSTTVSSSNGGPDCGGTICFQRTFWSAATFPRNLIHDCQSVRDGVLMHNKILFARPATKMKDERACAWAYLGSANLSESAWGKLVMDRKTKQVKLNCRNWECGVVVPLMKSSLEDGCVEMPVGLREFEETVPVPVKTPAERVQKPWFYAAG